MLRRRLRWLLGRGWTAQDFSPRYAAGGADAWGYRDSADHARRADWIMAALPQARFRFGLEVGCAQGFLTERLAPRVGRLIATDISAEAIARARENGGGLPNVEFKVADIRDGFPGDGFELCLFSDVLYYLSPRELSGVLKEAALRTAPGGFLMIVNEWTSRARGLTSPLRAFEALDADDRWRGVQRLQRPLHNSLLEMAIYRRATG